ncbi:hydroxysqualene dehydroxylase HpnE [Magnetovibrio sp. PR-2]|uniref:hydroxysqualene dehydroxylase HpnE n=1 Tax=Magnetovibrio sp. PR-2 TaxID=3120356 RepID=UPI002FCE6177
MAPCVHIIGAGVAGLSAAVRLAEAGVQARLHETAKHAGGRCRSFFDETMGATIDNGTHLILSGNTEVRDYARLVGGDAALAPQARAAFDFMHVKNGQTWSVDLGAGAGRWAMVRWLLSKDRQPPGFSLRQFVSDVRALKRGQGKTVSACVATDTPLFETFWAPMCNSVLNAAPDVGAAQLLWRVLELTVIKGGKYARPVLAPDGLGAALVDPAVAYLKDKGAALHFGRRITGLETDGGRVKSVRFATAAEVLGNGDQVIVATPPQHISDLVPGVPKPEGAHAILNVHYKLSTPVAAPRLVGLIGGACEWVQLRGCVASVTLSDAKAWMDKDLDAIAHALWPEVVQVDGLYGDIPDYRVIKERRATFAATPENLALRPGTRTSWDNLYLAGDWTDTGLPATLEGAVKSGRLAAEAVLAG